MYKTIHLPQCQFVTYDKKRLKFEMQINTFQPFTREPQYYSKAIISFGNIIDMLSVQNIAEIIKFVFT